MSRLTKSETAQVVEHTVAAGGISRLFFVGGCSSSDTVWRSAMHSNDSAVETAMSRAAVPYSSSNLAEFVDLTDQLIGYQGTPPAGAPKHRQRFLSPTFC